MQAPILDQSDFLPVEEFSRISQQCPTSDWKDGVVYNRIEKKEMKVVTSRHSKKIVEKRKEVIQGLEKIMIRRLLPWLRQQQDFQYIMARSWHTEWILYTKDMFFKPHQDFEKYICNNMVPYVALLGLEDTIRGGETIVEGVQYRGSTRKNGLVFFPGNVLHEAARVVEGEKKCLKMEFFVFFGDDADIIKVMDDQQQWKSFWSKEELSLVDNFITCNSRFKGSDLVTTSTETARMIHNISRCLVDPRRPFSPKDLEMIFPSRSIHTLHDLFVGLRFLRSPLSQGACVLGQDAAAWDFFNRWDKFPPHYHMFVVLWSKTTKDDVYQVRKIMDREGRSRGYTTVPPSRQFGDFNNLCLAITTSFLRHEELETPDMDAPVPKIIKLEGNSQTSFLISKELLKNIKPSDDHSRPRFVSGNVDVSETEMCNDEDIGITSHYSQYVQHYLQVRWCLLRCPPL